MPPAAKKDAIRYGPSDWPGCNEAGTSMLRGCRRGPWLGIGAFPMICEQFLSNRLSYCHTSVAITQVFATAEAFSSRTLAELRFPPARPLHPGGRTTPDRGMARPWHRWSIPVRSRRPLLLGPIATRFPKTKLEWNSGQVEIPQLAGSHAVRPQDPPPRLVREGPVTSVG